MSDSSIVDGVSFGVRGVVGTGSCHPDSEGVPDASEFVGLLGAMLKNSGSFFCLWVIWSISHTFRSTWYLSVDWMYAPRASGSPSHWGGVGQLMNVGSIRVFFSWTFGAER